jgi:hypothetical protein
MRPKPINSPEGYKVYWDNGHACGTFPIFFNTKREAEAYARQWKREMVSMDSDRKAAREMYGWEIVPQWPDETPIFE